MVDTIAFFGNNSQLVGGISKLLVINQNRKIGFRYDSKYESHELVPSFYLED